MSGPPPNDNMPDIFTRVLLNQGNYYDNKTPNYPPSSIVKNPLWKLITVPQGNDTPGNSSSGSYLCSNVYTGDDEISIHTAINTGTLMFDDLGHIYILSDKNGSRIVNDPNNKNISKVYKNPMIDPNIISSDIVTNTLQPLPPQTNSNFILNGNHKWIIYTEENTIYLLYNPMYSPTVKNWYNTVSNNNHQRVGQNLISKYCSTTTKIHPAGTMTDYDKLYGDEFCYCSNVTDCVNKSIAANSELYPVGNSNLLGVIQYNCACAASSPCSKINVNPPDNTFANTFLVDYINDIRQGGGPDNNNGFTSPPSGITSNGQCPSNNQSFCSVIINAGGNVNTTGTNISNTCGSSPPPVPSPTPTPSPIGPTPPPIGPTPVPIGPTPTPISPTPQASSKNTVIIITAGIISLLIIIAALYYFYLQKQQ